MTSTIASSSCRSSEPLVRWLPTPRGAVLRPPRRIPSGCSSSTAETRRPGARCLPSCAPSGSSRSSGLRRSGWPTKERRTSARSSTASSRPRKPSPAATAGTDGRERRRRPPTFLWRGVEWVLGPEFWGAYEYLSGDEISPALLNSAIRSPICPQCKEDAKAGMESGNQCLTCGQAFHLGPVVPVPPWEELKQEVYKKAQAAARRGELHLD